MDKNQKLHEQKSKTSWTKINELHKDKNQKFHLILDKNQKLHLDNSYQSF